ncbi:FAD binding domain-containing protein [Streptomyces sp. MP131-18]|uniref:FAD binding domain-containing protein n=1 Tax=Streptomyces sp. MP131-18 TaxID=1857892 RepID=UPI0009D1367D|nr:FAD binding domain-containing protein [Streptomyces sp. MP131-18]ONK14336.1 Carbon monoxide dehydrogenase medium chain [Streptomyces sp. MP131-18]
MTMLHRPESLDEACMLLAELDDAQVYGGGTAIEILRRQGILFTEDLVDVSRIPELRAVETGPDGVRAGAMVPVRRMETDPAIRRAVPLAARTYGHVANPRVRNTATVGGNVAHGDYRLDPPTALLVLDATIEARSVRGPRSLAVREFFTGFQETALEHDEVITAITVPAQPTDAVGRFVKMSSLSANDWPSASAAALLTTEDGRRTLHLGLGALAPVPVHLSLDVSGMPTERAVSEAMAAAEPLMDPIPDVRGSSDYKRRLGLVAVREAATDVCEERTHA